MKNIKIGAKVQFFLYICPQKKKNEILSMYSLLAFLAFCRLRS